MGVFPPNPRKDPPNATTYRYLLWLHGDAQTGRSDGHGCPIRWPVGGAMAQDWGRGVLEVFSAGLEAMKGRSAADDECTLAAQHSLAEPQYSVRCDLQSFLTHCSAPRL